MRSFKFFINFGNVYFSDHTEAIKELEDPFQDLSPSEKEHINNVMQRDAIVQLHLNNKIR